MLCLLCPEDKMAGNTAFLTPNPPNLEAKSGLSKGNLSLKERERTQISKGVNNLGGFKDEFKKPMMNS